MGLLIILFVSNLAMMLFSYRVKSSGSFILLWVVLLVAMVIQFVRVAFLH